MFSRRIPGSSGVNRAIKRFLNKTEHQLKVVCGGAYVTRSGEFTVEDIP